MGRNKGRITIWFEYAAFRAAFFLFRTLPLGVSSALGRGIAGLWCRIDTRHRLRVRDQIHEAYGGEKSQDECETLARAMYRHFGTCLAEIVRVPDLTRETQDAHIDWGGHEERVEALLAEGKGIIWATGHLGNWELCGSAFHLKGWSDGAIARPLDNPRIDRYIKDLRQRCGQTIWDKYGVVRTMIRLLREGKPFGLLVDQNAGREGVFVPFFGKQAYTIPTPADLAIRTGAPILFAAFHRTDRPMQFKLKLGRTLRADPEADRESERLRLLTLMNEDIETIIREAPEQWIWTHKRWKTRPPEESSDG